MFQKNQEGFYSLCYTYFNIFCILITFNNPLKVCFSNKANTKVYDTNDEVINAISIKDGSVNDKAYTKGLVNDNDYAINDKKVFNDISTKHDLVNDSTTKSKNLRNKEYAPNEKKVISEKSTNLVNDETISKESLDKNVNKAEDLKEIDKMKLVSSYVYQKALIQTFHTRFLTTQ